MNRPPCLLTPVILSGVFTHLPVLRAGEADSTPSVAIEDADPFDHYEGSTFPGEWATKYSQRAATRLPEPASQDTLSDRRSNRPGSAARLPRFMTLRLKPLLNFPRSSAGVFSPSPGLRHWADFIALDKAVTFCQIPDNSGPAGPGDRLPQMDRQLFAWQSPQVKAVFRRQNSDQLRIGCDTLAGASFFY